MAPTDLFQNCWFLSLSLPLYESLTAYCFHTCDWALRRLKNAHGLARSVMMGSGLFGLEFGLVGWAGCWGWCCCRCCWVTCPGACHFWTQNTGAFQTKKEAILHILNREEGTRLLPSTSSPPPPSQRLKKTATENYSYLWCTKKSMAKEHLCQIFFILVGLSKRWHCVLRLKTSLSLKLCICGNNFKNKITPIINLAIDFSLLDPSGWNWKHEKTVSGSEKPCGKIS